MAMVNINKRLQKHVKQVKAFTTTPELECAVASYIGIRQNLVIPNVSWGFDVHECDVLSMSGSGYLTEYEIKISLGDLKKDAHKKHQHKSDKIKALYFVIPSKLAKYIEFIPKRAGVMVVTSAGKVFKIADAEVNAEAKPLTDLEKYKLARLGALRIWDLRSKILTLKNALEAARAIK